MRLRLRRPRELAIALRELARRRPREAEQYLEKHEEQWSALVEADPHDAADILEAIDEVTAAGLISDLDPVPAAQLLEELNAEGITMLVITHDAALARRAPRRVEIRDGLVVADQVNGAADLLSESIEQN